MDANDTDFQIRSTARREFLWFLIASPYVACCGTDVFKALALGSKAVGIGRPFLWGLGAFGQAGVDRVLEILQGELKLAMGNCGTRTVTDITRDYVTTSAWKI